MACLGPVVAALGVVLGGVGAPPPLVADAGGPYVVCQGRTGPVVLDASQSSAATGIPQVSWNVGGPVDFAPPDAVGIIAVVPSSAFGPDPGPRTVDVLVTDAGGASDTASAVVNVFAFADCPLPALVVHVPADVEVAAAAAGGAAVTYDASATGAVAGTILSCSEASGSTFRVGSTTVECTATEPGGNAAVASFGVTVLPPGGAAADAGGCGCGGSAPGGPLAVLLALGVLRRRR
jgi:uncharacterized protein (TIGR03382 family)